MLTMIHMLDSLRSAMGDLAWMETVGTDSNLDREVAAISRILPRPGDHPLTIAGGDTLFGSGSQPRGGSEVAGSCEVGHQTLRVSAIGDRLTDLPLVCCPC